MNHNKYTGQLTIVYASIAILIATFASGCSPKPTTESGPSGSTTAAPAAKPGAKIGENNPAPGQPNHMSPEMQAQMQRYQDAAKK